MCFNKNFKARVCQQPLKTPNVCRTQNEESGESIKSEELVEPVSFTLLRRCHGHCFACGLIGIAVPMSQLQFRRQMKADRAASVVPSAESVQAHLFGDTTNRVTSNGDLKHLAKLCEDVVTDPKGKASLVAMISSYEMNLAHNELDLADQRTMAIEADDTLPNFSKGRTVAWG